MDPKLEKMIREDERHKAGLTISKFIVQMKSEDNKDLSEIIAYKTAKIQILDFIYKKILY